MSDINEIKQKITNGEYTYRPIVEAGEWEQLQTADDEILSLITTIESQKEEIKNFSLDYCGAIDVLEAKNESLKAITEAQTEKETKYTEMLLSIEASMMKFLSLVDIHIDTHQSVESQAIAVTEFLERQGAITELAVKGLKEIENSQFVISSIALVIARNTLSEISRLQNDK